MKTNPKAFTNSPSSRSVSVRDIGRFFIPRTTTLRGDGKGVKGFTLIELLVVVLIIGILAAVALPKYEIAVTKTRVLSLLPLMDGIFKAQQVYFLANNEYSDDLTKLDISFPEGATSITARRVDYPNFYCNLGTVHINANESYYGSLYCHYGDIVNLEQYFNGEHFMCRATNNNALGLKVCKSICGVSDGCELKW